MSLLMDALKKAEEAKRQGTTDEPPAEPARQMPSLALEPIEAGPATTPTTEPATRSLPDLPPHLDVLDADFLDDLRHSRTGKPAAPPGVPIPGNAPVSGKTESAAAASFATTADPVPGGPSAKPMGTPNKALERNKAQNLFDAKFAPPENNRAFAIAVGVATLMAAIGIGVYFWLQLKPGGAPVSTVPMPATQPPLTATLPATPAPPVPAGLAADSVEPPAPATRSPSPMPVAIADSPVVPRPAMPFPPGSPIRITTARLAVDPTLARAYDLLHAGNLTEAEAAYTQALKGDPKSADALHGMAALAMRQGQFDRAEEYYLRAIEADPRDAIALAGIIGLRGPADPVSSESRLKTLIASQPDQHFLHFALGNIYAASARWSEAQQAFFKAYSGDPEHPDYLFNLAVSLDHLRQTRLAAQYYNQALAAADARPATFDKAQAAKRSRELLP